MKNKDKVTIADLEREIADLRNGVLNLTITLAQERQANEELKRALHTAKGDAVRAGDEVLRQQEFQSRAHETIERLSRALDRVTA